MDHNQNNNGRQRIVRTEEQILAILDEFEKSGFTPKEFAELSDINDATFYSWLKKYRSKPEDEEPGGFIKVEMVPAKETRPVLFAKIGQIEIYNKELSVEIIKALVL